MQIVSYGVTPEIRGEYVISYSRNIHMNLCLKKKKTQENRVVQHV